MEWTVVLAGPAREALKRIPAGDRTRILAALGEMQQNPFLGDIRKLQGLPGFRRRVGTGASSSRSYPNRGTWSLLRLNAVHPRPTESARDFSAPSACFAVFLCVLEPQSCL